MDTDFAVRKFLISHNTPHGEAIGNWRNSQGLYTYMHKKLSYR